MKKQTYISPAVTICHCATATMLAASPEKNTNIGIDQEPGANPTTSIYGPMTT